MSNSMQPVMKYYLTSIHHFPCDFHQREFVWCYCYSKLLKQFRSVSEEKENCGKNSQWLQLLNHFLITGYHNSFAGHWQLLLQASVFSFVPKKKQRKKK